MQFISYPLRRATSKLNVKYLSISRAGNLHVDVYYFCSKRKVICQGRQWVKVTLLVTRKDLSMFEIFFFYSDVRQKLRNDKYQELYAFMQILRFSVAYQYPTILHFRIMFKK